jgi:hypothetical protein
MKKLFVLALALFFVAGLFSTVYAEDRLSLDGSYRVRAWYRENYSDFSDSNNDDKRYYWDQRFRLGGKIQVAEGISAHFRIDIAEVQWGQQTTSNRGWNRPAGTSDDNDRGIQVDRAYARWEKDFWIMSVGQAFTSFGNQMVVDQNQFGFIVRFKLPVVLDFVYSKIDESGSLNDDGDQDDVDFFGGQATYKADWWDVGALGGYINDNTDTNNSPWVVGLFGGFTYGMFAVKGEADFFGGDAGPRPDGTAGTADAKGTQLWVDAKANIMPNLYAGVEGFYAASYTNNDERQITGLTDSDSFLPEDWGTGFNTNLGPLNGLGSALGGTDATLPFLDPSGGGAGALGFSVYGNWRFMDKWQLRGKYMYTTPDKSTVNYINSQGTNRNPLDNVSIINLGLIWDCLPNTTARVGYNWTGPNTKSGFADADNAQAVIGQLQLTW